MMKAKKLIRIFFILLFFICIIFFAFESRLCAYDLSSYSKTTSKESRRAAYNNYVESANYYIQHDLYEEAKTHLWKAIEIDPANPDAYVNLGIVHTRLKEYDNAVRILKQAEELSDSDYFQSEILFYNLGLAYYLSSDYDQAIVYLSKAVKEYPEFAQALFYLGLARQEKGDFEGAFIDIFEARYIFEKNKDYSLKRNVEGQIEKLSQHGAIDIISLAQRFYEKGKTTLNQDQDLDKALYMFQESVFLNPNYTDAYYQLALLYSSTNAPHNAIAYLTRIVEVDPTNTNAYISLGYAYRDLRNYDKALYYLEKALETDQNNATVLYDIGVVYLRMEKTNTAEKYFSQSKKIALNEKNLFLVEKINNAFNTSEQIHSAPVRPLRVKKTIPPKESKKNIDTYRPVDGNAGSLDKGYFVPSKIPGKPKDERKPRVLLQQY
jgi:tetratricopeptide (TPR) repeat protein